MLRFELMKTKRGHLRVLTDFPNPEASRCQKWTNEDYAEIIIRMPKPLSSLL